eukprot:gene10383-12140_t
MSLVVTLTKSQVPSYLTESEFYKNLNADDDDEFCIPQEYYKPTLSVANAEELTHLFHTMKFWGLSKLPHEIIELLVFDPKAVFSDKRSSVTKVLLEFYAVFGLHTLYTTLPGSACKKERLEVAVKCGREDILEHLFLFHFDYGQFKTVLINEVAENGHVHLLERVADAMSQLSIKKPYKNVSVTTVASRRGGQLACLQYLVDQGAVVKKRACQAAVIGGNVECMKLLAARGAPKWDLECARLAAQHGRLTSLQYLLQVGCKVDHTTTQAAAQADGNDEFFIPHENFKPDLEFTNAAELEHLFHTFRYWGIYKLPDEIIERLIFEPRVFSEEVILKFDAEYQLHLVHQSMVKCRLCLDNKDILSIAVLFGKEDVLDYIFRVQKEEVRQRQGHVPCGC